MKELLFPPGATSHDWVLDALLTVGMALVTVTPYSMRGAGGTGDAGQLIAAVLMVLPLVLRRHSPLLMLAGVTVAGLVQLVVSHTPMATLAVVPVVAYSVARWIPGRESRLVLAIGAISSVLGPLRWVVDDPAHVSVRDMLLIALAWFVCIGLVITPYAIGRRVRESTEFDLDRLAVAEERYQRLLAEREQQNRLAESRARSQIARELHDIVAHSLSVMIVQAEGARAVVSKKPEVAAESLNTIAETGREALSEMRRIVGVLRDPAPAAEGRVDFSPAPTLEDIPELVARTSDRARLEVRGQPPRASAALALTAYRVVQEALTNFLKHAGPDATARVTVTYGKNDIVIDVLDNGVGGGDSDAETTGHGLRGMSERVSSMGGRLLTRSRPSGGFQVTAVLPNGN